MMMITTAQAQPFGGPWGCCAGPKEDDTFTIFLILAVVLVVGVLYAWDLFNEQFAGS